MTKKATDIVAYIGLIGWLIAFLAGSKEESKFHLNQALVLALAEIVLGVVGVIPIIGWIASFVGGIALFVFWIMGLVSAIQGTEKEVPLIGAIKLLK